MDRKDKGKKSEDEAARYLTGKNYQILQRNFRWKGGEIDLIARQKDLIVFVEVRSRASSEFGLAAETVQAPKREKIKRTALLYLQKNCLDSPTRFDVIAFDGENMTHIENAFD